jgi:hypothetical protein
MPIEFLYIKLENQIDYHYELKSKIFLFDIKHVGNRFTNKTKWFLKII